jgi:hypothetical protein
VGSRVHLKFAYRVQVSARRVNDVEEEI